MERKLFEFKATAITEGEGFVWATDEDEARAIILCQNFGQYEPTDVWVSRINSIKSVPMGKKAQKKA